MFLRFQRCSVLVVLMFFLIFALSGRLDSQDDSCAISGIVFDKNGKPVKGAKIEISCREHDYERKVSTNKTGAYLFDKLPPGTYDFTYYKHPVVCNSHGGDVTLERGVEVIVTLKMRPGTVRGKVIIEGGYPEGQRMITVSVGKKDDFGGPKWSTTASTGGHAIEINNLPAGSYEGRAFKMGYYCEPIIFKIPKKGKAQKDIEINLLIAGSILFKVTDRDGNPVKGIRVTEHIPGKGGSGPPTEEVGPGQYRAYASPGKHEYSISSSVKGKVSKSVTVKDKKEIVVEIEL